MYQLKQLRNNKKQHNNRFPFNQARSHTKLNKLLNNRLTNAHWTKLILRPNRKELNRRSSTRVNKWKMIKIALMMLRDLATVSGIMIARKLSRKITSTRVIDLAKMFSRNYLKKMKKVNQVNQEIKNSNLIKSHTILLKTFMTFQNKKGNKVYNRKRSLKFSNLKNKYHISQKKKKYLEKINISSRAKYRLYQRNRINKNNKSKTKKSKTIKNNQKNLSGAKIKIQPMK